jgi:hypothetical protein
MVGCPRVDGLDGVEIAYEGEYLNNIFDGGGNLAVGSIKMRGHFREGVLLRGSIETNDNRKFEIDLDKREIFEVQPDGSKLPIDQIPADVNI